MGSRVARLTEAGAKGDPPCLRRASSVQTHRSPPAGIRSRD